MLTKQEKAVIYGALLGDAHIQKRGNSYRAKIAHSIDQKDYVLWKYKKLKRLGSSRQPEIKNNGKNSKLCFFYLKSGIYLKFYHDLFYKSYTWKTTVEQNLSTQTKIRYKKTINKNLIKSLPADPMILAVWFLDDGSRRKDAFSGRLATQCYSKEEHFLLQHFLFSAFNIQTQIVVHHRLKNQYYLTIPAKNNNFANFVKLIKPFVDEIPCMNYKVNPRND